jgi:uncharacterized protein YdhG (YjbR/CyaY superfamily)
MKKKISVSANTKFDSIDEYHSSFQKPLRSLLDKMRASIREAAPEATETISYNIPTFKLKKNLVHYAAYESHIGFYPGVSAIVRFKKELSKYKNSKGAIQFPVSKSLPLTLIRKIVKFRVAEETI